MVKKSEKQKKMDIKSKEKFRKKSKIISILAKNPNAIKKSVDLSAIWLTAKTSHLERILVQNA